VGEEPERHLRSAGVVHAQEQHGRPGVVRRAVEFGQGVQPAPGEPLGQ
jgi:hypothetical protein